MKKPRPGGAFFCRNLILWERLSSRDLWPKTRLDSRLQAAPTKTVPVQTFTFIWE